MKKIILGIMIVMGTLSFGSEYESQENNFEKWNYKDNARQEETVNKIEVERIIKIEGISSEKQTTSVKTKDLSRYLLFDLKF